MLTETRFHNYVISPFVSLAMWLQRQEMGEESLAVMMVFDGRSLLRCTLSNGAWRYGCFDGMTVLACGRRWWWWWWSNGKGFGGWGSRRWWRLIGCGLPSKPALLLLAFIENGASTKTAMVAVIESWQWVMMVVVVWWHWQFMWWSSGVVSSSAGRLWYSFFFSHFSTFFCFT